MKKHRSFPKMLVHVTSAMIWCALNLQAQIGPTITDEPASQTNLPGTTVSFSVGVDGSGPFDYQWQFNGVNLPDIISTVAGNGSAAYFGDNGAATNAGLGLPSGVAFDVSGNLYITDTSNNRVRKVDAAGIITTVAGNGSATFSGDGSVATNASLNAPSGIAFDASGNLYIADTDNSCIRKVATNGIITTVAGNGSATFGGDGGAATNASLNYPFGVACDASGNLYIADYYNDRIRKVDANGIITTVAGNGIQTYGGDGSAATNASLFYPSSVAIDADGNLYIADTLNDRVREVNINGIITTKAGGGSSTSGIGDGGAAANASVHLPHGVAFDSFGNLYIADTGFNRVRKVDIYGTITTAAGNGDASYAGDGNGSPGYSGDGGEATNASLYYPRGVACDASGNLYMADVYNQRVREVNFANYPTLALTNINATNAGDYTVTITSLYGSVTGAVAVLTVAGPPVITIQPANQIAVAGSSPSFSVTAAGSGPFGYEWYFNGTNLVQGGDNSMLALSNIATNDVGNYTVVITNAYGSVTSLVATLTFALPPFIAIQPVSQTNWAGTNANFNITAGGTGPFTYQWQFNGVNLPNNVIDTVAGNGTESFSGDGGLATNASLYYPQGVAWDASGNLYISDGGNNRVRKVDPNGVITTVAGNGSATYAGDGVVATNASLNAPFGIAFDAADNLYIADTDNNCVRKVDTNGIITTVAGGGANYGTDGLGDGGLATNASLTSPSGVAVDAFGNLYIADQDNDRIREVDTNGIITTIAGNGTTTDTGDSGAATNAGVFRPYGLAFAATGDLYIADTGSRIRKVDTNGIITTVAGNGMHGYSGDGGAATNASLYWPDGVVVDSSGNLLIADSENNRIRKVDASGIITTVAGGGASYGTDGLGDGGVATNASLAHPEAVAFDASGNLYIADYYNNCVREVWLYGSYPTLALNNVGPINAGNYAVVITSAYGSVTSSVATMTVAAPAIITVQPTNQQALAGSSPDFSVTVAGSGPFDYEWYFAGTNLIQSGTNSTLMLPSVSTNNAGSYLVAVANIYGSVTSQVATLTVDYPPAITTQPVSQTNLAGSMASFYVTVEGTSPFSYQWLFNGIELPLAASSTLTITNAEATDAGNYSVVITSSFGSVTSTVATLTVTAPPVVIVQPASQIAAPGSNPGFSVTVAGSGPFGYAWFFASTNLLQSGTSSTLTLPDVSPNNAGNYLVVVTNAYGSVTSQVAALEFALPPFMIVQPASQTKFPNATVSFSVAVGNAGPFNYQWQFNGANISNHNYTITTVAGNGATAFSGDGGLSTNASLYYPQGVAIDAMGNLYIADTYNNRIRKVDMNGIITTVAGNGRQTYSGDGGLATNASLYYPQGVAFDILGNLYIADTDNSRIRKVDTNGIMTTVAGKSGASYSGDGGAATNASLNYPKSVAFDAFGDLYVADHSNNRIRKVDTNGIITTVAGKSGAGYSGDGGPATNANLYYPSGVAFDAFGNLYVADLENSRIRKVTTSGIITTVAGKTGSSYSGDGGVATNANLYYPSGAACDAPGNLYIADTDNNRIREVNTSGIITTVAGKGTTAFSGDGGTATNASLWYPAGEAFDAAGNLYVADMDDNRVRELHIAGNPTFTLTNVSVNNAGSYSVIITSSYGSVTSIVATLTVAAPPAITIQPASQVVAVGTNSSFAVTVAGSGPFDYEWYFGGTDLVQSGTSNTLTLTGVSTNNAGNYSVIVSNAYGSVTSQVATLTFALPPMITIQPVGQTNLAGTAVSFGVALAVADAGPFTYQWQCNGTNLPNNLITTVAGGGFGGDGGNATNASLNYPACVAFDASGNLYIADTDNSRIRKVDNKGIITSVAVGASLYYPEGIAFDAAGNLYVANTAYPYSASGLSFIYKVAPNGSTTVVAGNGSFGYGGDGGLATSAALFYPWGVVLDTSGNLYIADNYNSCVRMVNTNGIITTVAGGQIWTGRPSCLAFDASGDLYIDNSLSEDIYKVNANSITNKTLSSTNSILVAGKNNVVGHSGDGGAATNAIFNDPNGIAFDAAGNLYIADMNNSAIRKVGTNGIISNVAGNGSAKYAGDGGAATNASLNSPAGVALDASGNLYIADARNNRVREVHFGGLPTFALTSVGAANAGGYSVVITSPYGSVTSAVATLAVTIPSTPPQIIDSGASFGFATNQSGFGFNLNGAFGQTIVVDGSTNLMNWTPLFTNLSGGTPVYFFDPTSTNFAGRFYRARLSQ